MKLSTLKGTVRTEGDKHHLLCTGAVWAWEKSKAVVRHSVLQADSTYAVLTHGEAHADIQVEDCPSVRFEHLHTGRVGAPQHDQHAGMSLSLLLQLSQVWAACPEDAEKERIFCATVSSS